MNIQPNVTLTVTLTEEQAKWLDSLLGRLQIECDCTNTHEDCYLTDNERRNASLSALIHHALCGA